GKSRWITGPAARKKVHEDRNRLAAIMVGIGTVLTDDPMLNCRLDEFGAVPSGQSISHPVRIVCDSELRIPLASKLVKTARDIPVIVAAARKTAAFPSDDNEFFHKKSQLESLGVKVILVDSDPEDHVDLKKLVEILGREEKIDSILLEGGARLHESALKAGIVDKVQVYIAPKIFGGKYALSPVGGRGVDHPDQAYHFTKPEITRLGEDILLECFLIKDNDKERGDFKQSPAHNTREQEVGGICSQES
ncbi:MAG: RibD family protein, partial [Lachnospiraceae bacterium]